MDSVSSVSEEAVSGDTEPSELEVTGTTTLDGREMFVLTLPAGELGTTGTPTGTDGADSGQTPTGTPGPAQRQATGDPNGELTYYVDTETRYPRRLETATTVVDYSSWGEIDAITVPDLDCRTVE